MALVVEDVVTTVDTTNDTTKEITMPSGIVAGDLLLCCYGQDGNNTITYPGDWVELTGTSSGSAVSIKNGFKIADGSDTLTITAGANQQASAVVYRISGWEQDEGVGVAVQQNITTGSGSTDANPPSLTPNDGSKEYLFIAVGVCDRRTFDTTTPANYSNLQRAQSTGANGSSTATAERLLTTSSAEDPGVFSFPPTNDEWCSATILCHPVGSVDIPADPPTGALVLAGLAPIASIGINRFPGEDTLVLAGLLPTCVIAVNAFPGADTLVLGSDAPNLFEESIRLPGEDTLLLAGLAPDALVSVTLDVPTGTLVLAGLLPTRAITVPADPPVGALVLAGLAPVALIAVTIAVPVGALVLGGLAPLANVPVTIEPGASELRMNFGTPSAPVLAFAIDMPEDEDACP